MAKTCNGNNLQWQKLATAITCNGNNLQRQQFATATICNGGDQKFQILSIALWACKVIKTYG